MLTKICQMNKLRFSFNNDESCTLGNLVTLDLPTIFGLFIDYLEIHQQQNKLFITSPQNLSETLAGWEIV